MKAVVFKGIKEVEVIDTPDPTLLAPTDAIVKMESAAICGSDMHVYHGREAGIDVNTTMGHEFVGTVVEAGSEVRSYKLGDNVISPFTTSCGVCFYCRSGLTARCEQSELYGWVEEGKGLEGVHAEYVRVPLADGTLAHKPDNLSWEQANLLSDIFPTGYFCASMADIRPDYTYAVVGCGPVGLMAIISAFMQGATKVYALDRIPFRLEKAASFGAIPVNIDEEDALEAIRSATEGRGADAVLEAVGSKPTMESSFRLLRPGGILASVGVQAYDQLPFLPPELYDKNVTIKAGRCSARHYMEQLFPLMDKLPYDITEVITGTFSLQDGKEAYRVFDEDKDRSLKVLLKP